MRYMDEKGIVNTNIFPILFFLVSSIAFSYITVSMFFFISESPNIEIESLSYIKFY